MRENVKESHQVAPERGPERGEGEGQKPDASLCGQDPGSGGPVHPVQYRRARSTYGSDRRHSLGELVRQGSSENRGYWGQVAIGLALGGVAAHTLIRWRRDLGLPIWERRRPNGHPRMLWWTDDSMLLAWKLKMAQISRAKRYGRNGAKE